MTFKHRRLIKLIKDALSKLYKVISIRAILEDAGFVPGETDDKCFTPDGNPMKRMVVGMYLDKVDWNNSLYQEQLSKILQEILIDRHMIDYYTELESPECNGLLINLHALAQECGYITEDDVIKFMRAGLIGESSAFEGFDIPTIKEDFRRAREHLITDIPLAITSSFSLLEGVCKHLLDKVSISYSNSDNVMDLMKKVIDSYKLGDCPGGEQTKHFLKTVTYQVKETRGIFGTAHGKGQSDSPQEISKEKGELVVDLCYVISKFLLQTTI